MRNISAPQRSHTTVSLSGCTRHEVEMGWGTEEVAGATVPVGTGPGRVESGIGPDYNCRSLSALGKSAYLYDY
jgi:hypothetical protein